MNEQHRDPPRWLESGFLSEEQASELAAYGAEAPSAASKLRMLEQLNATPRAAEPFSLTKLALVGSVILAGVVGMLQLGPPAATQLAARERLGVVPTRVAPLAETRLAASRPAPSAEVPASVVTSSERVASVRPHAVPPRESAAPVSEAPQVSVEKAAQPNVLAELTMLARARRALLNDPARALELSEDHARHYPRGTFAEEREVLAIESLLKLGRAVEARAREHAFELSFPRSAQIAHLANLIAKP